MTTDKIMVVRDDNDGGYRLRIHLDAERGGTVMFQTAAEFSKPEADYRATILSSNYGLKRDELPTYGMDGLLYES